MLTQALSLANHVIIVLGSANAPRTIKNPFTEGEREAMIRACLTAWENKRVSFVGVEDNTYNDTAWGLEVSAKVEAITDLHPGDKLPNVVIVGHDKDDSTYYLRMFPQWKFFEVGAYGEDLSATTIRDRYFRDDTPVAQLGTDLPLKVSEFLIRFEDTTTFAQLRAERVFIDTYRASWAKAPYPPTFVTVDAVVVQSGHVLLIERRAEPGRGLWALPGGFLDQNERIIDATIRELREETRLRVPEPVLRGNIVSTKVFDAPDRSLRGRTITHASLIHLPQHGDGLPEVRGASDARTAKWWHLSDVKRSMMFEDHMDIIRHLTAVL